MIQYTRLQARPLLGLTYRFVLLVSLLMVYCGHVTIPIKLAQGRMQGLVTRRIELLAEEGSALQ